MRVGLLLVCLSTAVALLATACEPGNPGSPVEDAGATSGGAVVAVLPSPADPEITALVKEIDAAQIADSIESLASFTTRNTCSSDDPGQGTIGAAREHIAAQLAAIPGVSLALHPFPVPGCTLSNLVRQNVIAWIPGSQPDRLVILAGHYDSRTLLAHDGISPAPGANDSGSQTALLLEAARVMAGHAYQATVVFAAFAGEEQGLWGSKAFAGSYQQLFPGARVEAVLNCDIVGGDSTANDAAALNEFRLFSPGTPRETSGPDGSTDDTSPSRAIMHHVGEWAPVYVPEMVMQPVLREDRPGRHGDHESFIALGIPGVRFIEPHESLAHQHSPLDRMEFVTPAYTARVAQVVVSSLASLARAPRSPTSLQVTRRAGTSLSVSFEPGGTADHHVVAARSTRENLHRVRVIARSSSAIVTEEELGVAGEAAFFISVAAVDAAGHESLFAYPEVRCDAAGCAVPAAALEVTSTR
jgi:hypothetical protein